MPSYINFQDDSTYPGAKFRRMMGRQLDLVQGFDDPLSFVVKVSNDVPGKLEASPGVAWIKDQLGGVYFVERELDPLYVDTVGTSGTIVLRVKDLALFDGSNELLLQAIPTGSTIPVRSLRLATYTGAGSDAVLTDVRFTTSGQFLVSRSGPANYGVPNVAAMGLDAFSPGTQYTDLTTGLRYVKTNTNVWNIDKGPKGDIGLTGPQGIQGIQGVQGLKGDKGDPGTGSGTVNKVNTISPDGAGNVTLTAANVGALAASSRGAASGVASLDSSSKLDPTQIPSTVALKTDVRSSKSTTITAPAVASYVVWQAPTDCTVTAVRAIRVGGTSAAINASVNALDLLPLDLSLTVAGSWSSGPNLQNTAIKAGDSLTIAVRSVAGSPTYVSIQIDVKGV